MVPVPATCFTSTRPAFGSSTHSCPWFGEATTPLIRNSASSIEFFDRFRTLNVRSNDQLDALVEQARRVVGGVEAQTLRDNDGLRRHVATHLSQVQSVLDGMMVDRPRRRIVRSNPPANGEAHATED